MTANRILSAFMTHPTHEIMTGDILLMAAGCGLIGVLMVRGMLWMAIFAAVAAVASVKWPDFAGHLAILTMNAPLIGMLGMWRR